MVKKGDSVLAMLSGGHLLSYRGNKSAFSNDDTEALQEFSKNVKKDEDFKYVVPLSENNCFMLRSLIAEVLYISVEKDSGNIFFITDKTGEAFLRAMLYDFHTESTDLKTNLLKHQKEKIHIITSGHSPQLAENDIAFFFRRIEKSGELFDAKRAICILTLRDFYKSLGSQKELISHFESLGWSALSPRSAQNEAPGQSPAAPVEITIEETRHKGISSFYDSARQAGLCNGSLKQYIQGFAFFYMAAPIPLKWYDYYKPENLHGDEFIAAMLPSQSAQKIPGIGVKQSLILQAMCESLEQELQEENPKYRKIASAARMVAKENGTSTILMPNKIVADAFSWSLFEAKMARGLYQDDVSMHYPESFFIESLFEEKIFDMVIIPFVPTPEIILAAQNVTKKLHFILYPYERKLLYNALSNANAAQSHQWYNAAAVKKFSVVGNGEGKDSAPSDFLPISVMQKENSYNRFLSYLAKGDPKEGESHSQYEAETDKRHFTFVAADGSEAKVHGWESVILYNENESAFFRKYSWVAPSAIEKKDKIFIVPIALRYAEFEKELSENLEMNMGSLEELIKYIAEWKSALIATREKYTYSQIHKKLANAGLSKDYVTIRHWFRDLLDDPYQSAMSSVIDSKCNIGPKYAEDIQKFGDAFGLKGLAEHANYIHSAMRAIRANNQHMGKANMNKILSEIENPEIRGQCIFVEVKRISVTSHIST